jgi:hypothetical protein
MNRSAPGPLAVRRWILPPPPLSSLPWTALMPAAWPVLTLLARSLATCACPVISASQQASGRQGSRRQGSRPLRSRQVLSIRPPPASRFPGSLRCHGWSTSRPRSRYAKSFFWPGHERESASPPGPRTAIPSRPGPRAPDRPFWCAERE